MGLSEDFLCFIWRFRLFNTNELYCKNGERLEILAPGILNNNSGPDFNQAKLLIDGTIWAGNVEINIKSSDWLLYGHQEDNYFDSVILHVVYQQDKQIYRRDGTLIPVLILKGLFQESVFNNYTTMITSLIRFPCEMQIKEVDAVIVKTVLSRVIVERVELKSAEVLNKLEQLKGNWNETFYHFVAQNFGFNVNAVPFELLAGSLSQQILAKHKDNGLQIEALIFGQAGFLEQSFCDDYPALLKYEYGFLRKKYGLKPIDVSLWKFFKMRPQNFPTIRLAQFSALISGSDHLFSKILEIKDLKLLYLLFNELHVNEYWLRHYHFNKSADNVNVQLGQRSVQNVIINTVCVFLFAYGRYTDQQDLIDRALDFLEEIPAENNSVITQYIDSGVEADNAFVSQALLQLNKYYCVQKKCLICGIGIKILNK